MSTAYDQIKQLLADMINDPFGRQVLRDLVPQGKKITPALPSDLVSAAIQRAIRDSDGLPAYLAVGPELTIVIVELTDFGQIKLSLPGDWGPSTGRRISATDTLDDAINTLRRTNTKE
jgi:hypothetical protein